MLPPVAKPKDPAEERRLLEEKEKKLAKDLQQQLKDLQRDMAVVPPQAAKVVKPPTI